MDTSAIRSVSFYEATPVETCDRCSAGIRYVSLVTYRDGQTQKYGSECINKILNAAPTLRGLFNKNSKLLKRHQEALRVLSLPVSEMPRGREYYGSGLYFIADSTGKDISTTHWFFHPLFDEDKNQSGSRYVVIDSTQYHSEKIADIELGKDYLRKEIARLESFLAKVLRSIPALDSKS
jgi:hypothetical protein